MTYALVVSLESYEYWGQFRFVGDGQETPGDVLRHAAAEHIQAIEEAPGIEAYLLDVLAAGENASRVEYQSAALDLECRLQVDTHYGRFWFETGDERIELPTPPTQAAIEAVADRLDAT